MSKASIEITEDFGDGEPIRARVEYCYDEIGLDMNDLCERVLKPVLLSIGYAQATIDKYINSGD